MTFVVFFLLILFFNFIWGFIGIIGETLDDFLSFSTDFWKWHVSGMLKFLIYLVLMGETPGKRGLRSLHKIW